MQSKTIYRILAVVLVLAAIYYLFFTGPGTEDEQEPQTTEISDELTPKDSVIASEPVIPNVQEQKKERPKAKPQRVVKEGEVEFEVYVVQEGETLQDIAMNVYGDSHKWYKLFAINESRIDDWNVIRTGQKLLVPKN